MRLFNNWLNRLGNPTNVYEANSREANENLLLDTYMLVLTDDKNITETRLPLDKVTGVIKNEILPVVDSNQKKGDEVPFLELSPTFQMNKKYEYSGGKTGIGPFALNNKNHVITQLTNLMFKDNTLLKSLGFTGLNGIKSQNETVYKRDKYGNIKYDANGVPIMIQEEGLNILDWISAMINAHVDVAKDPYVIRLNVRQYTYNICNFLLRAGFGKNTFYFLPQPILKQMALAYERANGIYGVKGGSKTSIVNEEIRNIRRDYYKKYTEACAKSGVPVELDFNDRGNLIDRNNVKIEDYAPVMMGRDYLIDALLDTSAIDTADADVQAKYYRDQLRYSEIFLQLNTLAQDMSKLVQLSQIDTKRYGGNFVEQDRFMYRLKSFLNTTTLFNRADVEKYFAESFLLTKAINGMILPASIFQDTMFRSKQSFKDSVTKVLSLIRMDNVNDEALNKTISNELEGQIRWKFLNNIDGFNLYNMFYGKNSMAQRLANIKNDIIQGKYPELLTADGKIANKLLDHLTSLARFSTDAYNAPAIIATNRVNETDKFLKQDLKLYWEELLESPHEEIKQFANDLISYELATTAGNFTKNGIWNLLPVSAILNSGYASYIDNAVKNFTEADLNYNDLFLNNWNNSKIVPTIDTKIQQFDEEVGEVYDADRFPILYGDITINNSKIRVPVVLNPNRPTVGKNSLEQPLYTPYVKVVVDRTTPEGILLYKYVGTVLNNKGNETPLYVITYKKGLNQGGRVIKEYDGYSNSIFDFNNIKGAIPGNSAITIDSVINTIQALGDKTDTNRWITEIKESFTAVNDITPVTQALYTNLLTLGLDVQPTETYTEQTNQGDIVEVDQSEANVFTFKDGTKINIPFKLNEQQTKALLVLEDFVNNSKKYGNVITLCGYAGTGKSTLIGIFDKYLKSKYINPKYSAPTHRANAVTKMNNPEANVSTLHSLFGLTNVIDLTDGNYDLRKLKNQQRNRPKLKNGSVLIIDEASMISKGLFQFIEDYKNNHNVKIIYVGDDAQLAPVNDDTISPVFTGNYTKLQLTKVERTGDNAILAESTRLRNKQDFSYETRDNVEFTNSTDRANEVIDTIVNSDEFKTNPLYFRILSATNDMISDANNRVRRILFGDNSKQIEVGDVMMGYSNVLDPDADGAQLIANSIDYVVSEVSELQTKTVGLSKVKVKGYNVVLDEANARPEDNRKRTVFVLSNDTDNETLQKLSDDLKYINTQISQAFMDHNYDLANRLMQLKSQFEASTVLMRDYTGSGNRLLLHKALDYGYAHTIHKSQGGTYNNVLIYADTINRFSDPLVKQQLKYVAMSRAKDNVVVLTSHAVTGTREVITDQNLVTNYDHNWTRREVENQKDKLFIFTDNTDRDSGRNLIDPDSEYAQKYGKDKHYPTQTQAVIRGLNNAMPISTQRWYHEGAKGKSGQWTDDAFEEFKTTIDAEIEDIKRKWDTGKYKQLVFGRGDVLFNGPISEITEQRVPRIYNYLQQKYQELVDYVKGNAGQVPEQVEQSTNPKDYHLYSGGAVGADTKWGEIASKYNIGKIRHYRPETLDVLTPEQMQEVETAYVAAANKLGRKILDSNTLAGKLVRRDYLQAKAADSIFAIGHILRPGEKNSKGYTVRSTIPSVDGGTGYAVQMAIDLHKPVHVYDQVYDQWYRFDYNDNTFVAEDIPTLTPKFAGIGTREITDKGINAIEQVFQNTFGSIQTQTGQPNTINIWHSSNENADLSNFAIRPFNYKGIKFDSVEQGFQFAKVGYSTNNRNNEITGNKILFEKSGSQLRKLGKQVEGLDIKEWEANKHRIMKEMIKASFEQNPKAKQRLLSTGDATLTHNQEKGEWKTEFPRILMEVRNELRQQEQPVQQQQTTPFDLTSFATFDESELRNDLDIEQMNRDGEQIKKNCKGE